MKSEFEARTKRPCSTADYVVVEYVYTYHPCIESKDDAAVLWDRFGMRIFLDMLNTAKEAEVLERKVNDARRAYEKAVEDYRAMKEFRPLIKEGVVINGIQY